MDRQHREFGSRVKRIDRRHRKLADGYVSSVSTDGLVVAVPRSRRMRVPFAGLALLALGIIGFKGIVHSQLGPTAYEARIDRLAQGSQVEKVGAWVMQADPLTLWVSEQAAVLTQ